MRASVIRLPPTVRLPQLIAVSSVVFIASMLLILSAEIGRRIAQRRYGREFSAQGLAWSR